MATSEVTTSSRRNRPRDSRVSVRPSEIDNLVKLIAQATLVPGIDGSKLERLVAFRERMHETSIRSAYEEAFTRLQLDLPVLSEQGEVRDRTGKLLHTYARWEDINEIIKPLLSRHGFSLRFRTEHQDGKVVVTGILSHRDGFSQDAVMRLPADLTGDKNAVQAVGSSTSYGKRYAAAALLNLTSRGEDDDGAAAMGTLQTISGSQAALLRERLKAAGRNEARLAGYFGVRTIEELPIGRLQRALDAVDAKWVPA